MKKLYDMFLLLYFQDEAPAIPDRNYDPQGLFSNKCKNLKSNNVVALEL